MWSYAIPALCVLSHLHLILIFLPGYWRELDRRGVGWQVLFVLFAVPLLTAGGVTSHVLRNLDSIPAWLLVVSFLTVDALVLAMVLSAVALGRRRRQRL